MTSDDIDHAVGDRTMIVRPVRPRFAIWLPIAITALAVGAVVAVMGLRHRAQPAADPGEPHAASRSTSRVAVEPAPAPTASVEPPTVEPTPAAPVAPITIAEPTPADGDQATRTDIDAIAGDATPETANEAPREPGTLVKLRDNEAPAGSGTQTKKVRRKRVKRAPTDATVVETTWDPNALFPQK